MEKLKRNSEAWINELLAVSPIVVIEGARQVGKSTLATMIGIENTVFTTMDDDLSRAFAHDDPTGFLQSAGQGRLVIDEIQRCPELILPLKAEVDRFRDPGRFLLTGSANLMRVPGAEDSLAGRAMTVRLHPFSQGELVGKSEDWVTWVVSKNRQPVPPADRDDIVDRLVVGGYPPIQGMSAKVRGTWLRNYAGRLVERDALDAGVVQVPVLRDLLYLVAAAPGAELVQSRLAQNLGVTRATVVRYLNLLESLFLVHCLPAWSRNLSKRQVGRPKCYVTDTGLNVALSKLDAAHLKKLHGADHLGPLLESFVVNELLRQQGWSETDFQLSHYRDSRGVEVDVIIETPQGVIGVEVKSAKSATARHFTNLAQLRDRLGEEFLAGIVLTTGEGQRAGDRLEALPVTSLWEHC
ncbi:MAG: ATP-binding protein [Actinomycetaceae bacterium]|nr:ATP-binding protein [Actinomycetaceae bacterium]